MKERKQEGSIGHPDPMDLTNSLGIRAVTSGDLIVSVLGTDQVLGFDGGSGAFTGVVASCGGLGGPLGATYGPDDNLYVASFNSNEVIRYDEATGICLGVFASGNGLAEPHHLMFDTNGDLLVSSMNVYNNGVDTVQKYEGPTKATPGKFLGDFLLHANMNSPREFLYGPGGDIFVAGRGSDNILRFDSSGAFQSEFSTGPDMYAPTYIAVGSDGYLYVTNFFNAIVARYDVTTGTFVDDYLGGTGTAGNVGIAFGPTDGHLYLAHYHDNVVRRYEGPGGGNPGNYIDDFVTTGLIGPICISFVP